MKVHLDADWEVSNEHPSGLSLLVNSKTGKTYSPEDQVRSYKFEEIPAHRLVMLLLLENAARLNLTVEEDTIFDRFRRSCDDGWPG